MLKIIILMFVFTVPISIGWEHSAFINEYVSFREAAIQSKTLTTDQLSKLETIKVSEWKNDVDKQIIAFCDKNTNHIHIDMDKFKKQSKNTKQHVLDHEMGHCILSRSHVIDEESIMIPEMSEYDNAVLFSPEQYGSLEESQELFEKQGIGNQAYNEIVDQTLNDIYHKRKNKKNATTLIQYVLQDDLRVKIVQIKKDIE